MSHMEPTEALAYYGVTPTDNHRRDIETALKEAARRRVEGPQATAALIRACRDELKMSYRDIEAASEHPTGARIATATAQRIDVKHSR